MDIANSIAIIGMAGRFPGAQNLDEFWDNLVNGVEGISQLDDETLRRLEPDFDELNNDPDYVKAAGVLEGVELFDANFFGIKPREARALDPQHRIWFETAWTAMENAALAPDKYDGKVGVFCGSYINSYLFYNLSPDREAIEGFVRLQSLDSFLHMITNEKDYLPTRTSYLLNLTGPSINVQTACSTSLVAVAQACQSLLNFESDAALAGGVAIFLPQERGYVHTEGGMLSADGHCRPFSDGASGTVFGSGVGCVVLKRLEDALAEGDNVLAVIRGAALNNDGAHKASYTAPSIKGQSDVISLAQALADVEPDDISYIEAHGTATPLGDPIEVAGLTKAFRRQTDRNQFVALGATKSSIGHLDAASGVAGLIKTVLSLQNEKLPPVLHFERENPEIEFATTPFYVVDKLMDWQRNERPRIAGISSFGVGGTNAHVVVQEAPLPEPTGPSRPRQLLTLSAKTESALTLMCENLARWLALHPDSNLADVAWTLRVGRADHPIRTYIVAATHDEAIEKLQGKVESRKLQGELPVTFLFPGQGSQFPEMGRELYENEAVFRETVNQCVAILEPLLGEDLLEILYPSRDGSRVDAAEKLKNTGIAQPAIFVIEYALAKLWMSWGIQPARMIGHSVGEFAAACLAGIFSLEDALTVLANRARLMRDLPGGAMRAVRMSQVEVAPYLTDGVALAAANAPDISIVSGSYEAIERFDARLAAQDIVPIKLHTSHAFHSEMMEPILQPFHDIVAGVTLNAPTIEMISTVSGRVLSAEQATSPTYWTRQLRQPVLFSDAITHAMAQPHQLFLEIGPSKNLSTAAKRHAKRAQQHVIIDSLGHAKKAQPALEAMLEAVGNLWQTGIAFDWENATESRRKVALPTYPFERKRYWIDPPAMRRVGIYPDARAGMSKNNGINSVATTKIENNGINADATKRFAMSNRRKKIFEKVTEILYELSGIDLVSADGDTSFIELGFDSLTLTQVSTLLKKTLRVNVKFRRLLEDVDTPNALTGLLEETLPAEQFADEPVIEEVQVASQQPAMAEASVNGHAPASNGYHAPAQQPMMQPQMPQQPMMQMPQMQMPQPMMGNNNQMMLQMMLQQQMMLMQMMMQQQQPPMAFQQPMMPQQQGQVAGGKLQMGGGSNGQRTTDNGQRITNNGTNPKAKNLKSTLPDAPKYAPRQGKKRFVPYKEVQKGRDGELTARQQAHLDELTRRLTAKTPKSKAFAQEYRDVAADPRTIAAFRLTWKEIVYQIVTERSKGAYVWDIDGNKYVDLTMGFGVGFLGHSPDFVIDAVREQLDKGIEIGPQNQTAGEVARMLQELVGVERVSFCNTGSEANMAAIRMARTTTGRDKIVYFSGDYHGMFEEVLARPQVMRGNLATLPSAPGIPKDAVKNAYVLEYGDPASLEFIREHKDELAAVLIEAVQSRHPDNRPTAFIKELRQITAESETALIFDEVITGFRVHPRGMQEIYGVQPDLVCYGKIIGGGLPIGVVAGKARFIDGIDGGYWQYGDESVPEAPLTFFAGTFVRHPMSMVAAKAVLTFIKQQGASLQQRVNSKMTAFANEMNAFFEQRAVPIEINHYSSWFRFEVPSDIQYYDLLFYHLLEKGVYVFTFHQNCFFSIEHTDADIAFIKNAIKQSVIELQTAGFLPGAPTDVAPVQFGNRRTPMPLTEAQQEIWLAAQMDQKASLPYNESFSLRLRGSLHPTLLRQSAQAVIERHSALHHRFSPAGEWQRLSAETHISIPIVDLTDMGSPEAELDHLMTKTLGTPFDLIHGPLVRATLYRLSATEYVFHWTAHHIVYDGWSAVVVIDEIRDIYNALVEEVAVELEEADSFREYVAWERAEQTGEAIEYWREQFADLPPVLDLPTDRPRPAQKTYNGTSYHYEFDADVIQAVRATAKRQKSSLFIMLLTAYNVLLHRLTNQSDIVVGIPLAGQAFAGMDNLVGHCVNIVPLRSRFASDTPFNALLGDVRSSFLDAQEHQPITFGTLVRELNVPRDPSRSPLVETVFNLDRKLPPKPLVGLEMEIREVPKQAINWEMFLNLYEEGETLKADFDYNSDLYDESTIAQWLEHFETLLREIATVPERAVGDFNLLSNSQLAQIAAWNDTTFESDPNVLVHELVATQADRTPSGTAWVFEGDKLSYRTLDHCANMLANYLQEQGIGNGDRVGLFMDRSLDMGVAVLGVLKAGATYVPLAPDYPAERVAFILEDSDARLLISQEQHQYALAQIGKPVLLIDRDWERIERYSEQPPACMVDADSTALIIYTSGSTGRPKGAMLSHRALANFIQWYPRHYGLGEKDGMLLKAPFGFDAASWEILTPLVSGGRVVAAKPGGEKDSIYLTDLMKREKVTNTFLVPTQLRMLMQNRALEKCASTLKVVCVGGEAFPEDLREEFFQMLPNTQLDNIYGPSETTVMVLAWDARQKREGMATTPIGKPISNMQMQVLNERGMPVPVGVQGELWIGGVQVGSGYWNRPNLTAEKFVRRREREMGNGERRMVNFYRTGDYVRWNKWGGIEFIGRIDHQVKLRGLRIELGEIESGLIAHEAIDQAVVLIREDDAHDKRVIAYCVLRKGGREPSADVLRTFLRRFVPQYMVPSAYVMLPELPTTPNGKINRTVLPMPAFRVAARKQENVSAPRDALEHQLADLIANVLKIPTIGIHDDFFDMGGHSLMALRLFQKIEDQFGKKLPLATLFSAPTVAQLAEMLRDEGWEPDWNALVPIRPSGHKTPFFHVGAYMESILAFEALGDHLDKDRPFYGIQPRGLNDESEIQTSIEAMAAAYIDEIKQIQPHGPYLLGGHCAGAVVAYEMAKQLEAAGEKIEMLAIVDSPAPNYEPPSEHPLAYGAKRMWYYLRDRRLIHALAWQTQVQLESKLLYRFGSEQAQRVSKMRQAHTEAYEQYEISDGYHGPMTIYRSEEYLQLYDEDIHAKWGELTTGEVRFEDVTGTHATLLKEPHVAVLGKKLRQNLESCQQAQR